MFAVSSEPRMNHKAKQWKWIENNEHRPRESSSTRGNADEHVEQNIASFVLEHDEQTYCNNTLDKENASANRSHDTNKISGSRQHPHKLSSDHDYSAKNEKTQETLRNRKNTRTCNTQIPNTLKQQGTGRIYKQHHCLVLYKQTLRSITRVAYMCVFLEAAVQHSCTQWSIQCENKNSVLWIAILKTKQEAWTTGSVQVDFKAPLRHLRRLSFCSSSAGMHVATTTISKA